MYDLCICECVVLLLQNPLCIRVYSRSRTHVIFNPNKECTPQGQSRSLQHSRHPYQFAHKVDQANYTSYYRKGRECDFGRLRQESNMNCSWKKTPKKHVQTSSEPNNWHLALQTYDQLYEAMKDLYKLKIVGGDPQC